MTMVVMWGGIASALIVVGFDIYLAMADHQTISQLISGYVKTHSWLPLVFGVLMPHLLFPGPNAHKWIKFGVLAVLIAAAAYFNPKLHPAIPFGTGLLVGYFLFVI